MREEQKLECLVGFAPNVDGQRFWIGYRPAGAGRDSWEAICFQFEVGPGAKSSVLRPKQMLEHRPHIIQYEVDGDTLRIVGIAQEPPGWFVRICRVAHCEWFVPMAERMAAGEPVPLEEMQAAYLAHNGTPMPCGTWDQLFR